MTTAVLEKRVAKLEAEIRSIKSVLRPHTNKLPHGVIEGLRDFAEGRYSGPFSTVGELRVHLEK
jgi:hypothetical protein